MDMEWKWNGVSCFGRVPGIDGFRWVFWGLEGERVLLLL